MHTFEVDEYPEGRLVVGRLLPHVRREDRVGVVEDVALLELGADEVADLVHLFGGVADRYISSVSRYHISEIAGGSHWLASRRQERLVHGDRDVLVFEAREEQVEVVDLLDLRDKLGEMVEEGLGVVVVKDVEVDAMPSTRQERRAVPQAAKPT